MDVSFERITPNSYQLSPELQARFDELRDMLRRAAPEAEESWSYSMPALRLNKRILLNFAVWKNHCGIYPGAAVISQLMEAFPELSYSKGTCLLSHEVELPQEVIWRIVEIAKLKYKR